MNIDVMIRSIRLLSVHAPPDHLKPTPGTGDGQKFASKYHQACWPDTVEQPLSSNYYLFPPPHTPHSMLVRTPFGHLQTFVRGKAPNTGANFQATLSLGGRRGGHLKHLLTIMRSIFTCKLLSVTCPKWIRGCVRWYLFLLRRTLY